MAKTRKKKVVQKKKKKKSNFLPMLFSIVILIGIIFGVQVSNNGGGLKGVVATLLGQSKSTLDSLETKYVLLLGISKDINVNLTDTIMVAAYNPNMQKATIMSISRDTFVGSNEANAKATDKLNSIYSQYGVEGILKRVNKITGLDIEDYVIINNNAVVEIVDAIGGVEFDVPIDMKYDDPTQDLHIDLSKGMQKIDGQKAEWLLRFRHNNDGTSYPASYGDNDIGRMRTQREFIKEVVKQTIDVKNVFNIKSLINTIYKNIEISMDRQELFAYISCVAEFNVDNLKSYAFPTESKKCNGLWFEIYDRANVKNQVSEMEKFLHTSTNENDI